MRLSFRYVVVFIMLLIGAAPARAETLLDSVVSALDNNPAIAGIQDQVDAADHGKKAEIAAYYPEVSASATAGRIFQDNSTSRGLVTERGAAYSGYGDGSVAMRQMLFDGLETKNRVKAADARLKSKNYDLLETKEEIIFSVVSDYIEILRIRSALILLSEQFKTIEDYKSRIVTMVKEGVADEAELQQALDVSMVVDSVVADYEGRLASVRASYYEATGRESKGGFLVPPSVKALIDNDIVKAVAVAKERHPMLMSVRMASNAARHDMKVEQGKMYPDVSGELSYNKVDKKDVIGGQSRDARAVIKMNWAFSTGGREFEEFRKKQSEHDAASRKILEVERQVERRVYESYAIYRTMQRKKQLSADRVELNEKLVDAYRSQFEGSRISLLSLMRAESQLFSAKLEYSDNRYNLLAAEYGVLASTSRLKDNILSAGAEVKGNLPAKGE